MKLISKIYKFCHRLIDNVIATITGMICWMAIAMYAVLSFELDIIPRWIIRKFGRRPRQEELPFRDPRQESTPTNPEDYLNQILPMLESALENTVRGQVSSINVRLLSDERPLSINSVLPTGSTTTRPMLVNNWSTTTGSGNTFIGVNPLGSRGLSESGGSNASTNQVWSFPENEVIQAFEYWRQSARDGSSRPDPPANPNARAVETEVPKEPEPHQDWLEDIENG